MGIVKKNRLTETEIKEIGQLIDACNAYDKTEMGIYLYNDFHFYQDMDCFFLYREDDLLLGFLSVYADDANEADISGCVLPTARRKGIFRKLYECAKEALGRYNHSSIQLVSQKDFLDKNPIMPTFGAVLDSEEYTMRYNPDSVTRVFKPMLNIFVRKMEEADIAQVVHIMELAFGETPEVALNSVHNALREEHLLAYVITTDEQVVGAGNVDFSGKGRFIYGLCVDPEQQGKGFGAFLLINMIRQLRDEDDREISLRVNSNNLIALLLYQSCGFDTISVQQYFLIRH